MPRGQTGAWILFEAGRTGQLIRPAVFGKRSQGAALLGMDHDAQSDRASPEEACSPFCPARRFGAAKTQAGIGPRISKQSILPSIPDDERWFDRAEPASGKHGDQC